MTRRGFLGRLAAIGALIPLARRKPTKQAESLEKAVVPSNFARAGQPITIELRGSTTSCTGTIGTWMSCDGVNWLPATGWTITE